MIKNGFYIISDKFFEDFPDPFLKGNKKERRPHYYAIKDDRTGLFWMIPMSSRIEKYSKLIEKRKKLGKPCDILHIAKLDNGKESVFLIQDICPISKKYILRRYTIADNHLKVTSEHLSSLIDKKARKTIGMLRRGIKFNFTQADVLKIEKALLEKE